jgi:hypothetical protein
MITSARIPASLLRASTQRASTCVKSVEFRVGGIRVARLVPGKRGAEA